MQKIFAFLLTAALTVNLTASGPSAAQPPENRPTVVEDNYFHSDTYRIVQSRNGYEKLTARGKERYKQTVRSTKAVLSLPLCADVIEADGGFLLPSAVEGIAADIPYNYYSSPEASAAYFHTLLRNEWEIEYYNASSLCVQVGLVKDGITCRLLIYENYLKVYCKLIDTYGVSVQNAAQAYGKPMPGITSTVSKAFSCSGGMVKTFQ